MHYHLPWFMTLEQAINTSDWCFGRDVEVSTILENENIRIETTTV